LPAEHALAAEVAALAAEDVIFDSDGFVSVSDGQAATEILDEGEPVPQAKLTEVSIR